MRYRTRISYRPTGQTLSSQTENTTPPLSGLAQGPLCLVVRFITHEISLNLHKPADELTLSNCKIIYPKLKHERMTYLSALIFQTEINSRDILSIEFRHFWEEWGKKAD